MHQITVINIYILPKTYPKSFSSWEFYCKGCSISSVTHYQCWKQNFLFLTLQKKAKKHHFLTFPQYLASFCKRDESNSAYYSRFSLYLFETFGEFPILHIIFIVKKVLEFSNILSDPKVENLEIHSLIRRMHAKTSWKNTFLLIHQRSGALKIATHYFSGQSGTTSGASSDSGLSSLSEFIEIHGRRISRG